jgi:electron transfer flavoprotein alpha subunit
MKKIENVLIVSDNDSDRLAELNFVAHKFTENTDAVIFTEKSNIPNKFRKVYGINDLPVNAVEVVFDKAKTYDVVITSGYVGASLGAILAYKLKASLMPAISSIDFDKFEFLHSAYGDKAVIKYQPTHLPLVLILKEKNFEQYKVDGENDIEWLQTKKDILITKEEKIKKEVELDKVKVVVGGGRGIGSKENFGILEELAHLLGGVVGGSRAAVDNGWISHQRQVGQSGVALSANLYFAFAISGATQHLSGIKNVKCVVAINTDEEAPIFKRARYGIVADWKSFALELIKMLKGGE